MIDLDSPVEVVPKIGPKYKKLLEKLSINTVDDLVHHFPFRYDDFSQVKNIKELIPGEHVTIKGVLGPVQNIFTRNGKKITKADILDSTGFLTLIWFNQHYIKNTLTEGKRYCVSGVVSTFDRKNTIISPEMEEMNENNLNTGRLVPVYPETYGVSSKWLRSRINDIIKDKITSTDLEETIPFEISQKYQLMDFKDALLQIHFPDSSFQAEQARKRFAYEELFTELLRVEKRKREWSQVQKGHQIKASDDQMEKFYKSLPFELTDSQHKAIKSILTDLSSDKAMNRLLEGDVGAGKTIVAIAASYATYLSGLRTIYLAPTEILANQHFLSYKNFLKDSKVKIGYATSSAKIDIEDADIIVGTHALLFNEKYKNIGLVIIDEQHRFGVEQRGKLLDLAKENLIPNLLTLTATPIPRTLALTLYGDLDISILENPEIRQRHVETKILADNKREETYKWAALNKVPTFIVCPLIDDSESESLANVKSAQSEFEAVQKYYPSGKVGLLHGRMKPKKKQDMIDKFTNKEILALVATPVIEVGIDIPDASVIIIQSGERYGLANLHQLRGRVGRKGQKAYCMIFMSNYSQNSYERLKNLEQINDGLKLAEIDMHIRGQGDIFSTLQHGYKKFRLASLDNLEMLEQAKADAESIYPYLNNYPKLLKKLQNYHDAYIRNN